MIGPIEPGIPVPPIIYTDANGRPGAKRIKYRFADMRVGDSFFTTEPRPRIARAAQQYGQNHGLTFTVRTWNKGHTAGFRVWRMA